MMFVASGSELTMMPVRGIGGPFMIDDSKAPFIECSVRDGISLCENSVGLFVCV